MPAVPSVRTGQITALIAGIATRTAVAAARGQLLASLPPAAGPQAAQPENDARKRAWMSCTPAWALGHPSAGFLQVYFDSTLMTRPCQC
ncbi:hypothetical protein [Streptomyces sp. NPDC001275]